MKIDWALGRLDRKVRGFGIDAQRHDLSSYSEIFADELHKNMMFSREKRFNRRERHRDPAEP
jgi:hypothetical protein